MNPNTIMGLFAKSPIKPIEAHISKVCECCEVLPQLFAAVYEPDSVNASSEQLLNRLLELAREADELQREARTALPTGIFLPVHRSDMISLLNRQAKLAGKIKKIAYHADERGYMEKGKNLYPEYTAFLARCLDATRIAARAVNELDELLETGFRGSEVTIVQKMVNDLGAIEQDVEKLQSQLRRGLVKLENELTAVEYFHLYSFIKWTGQLAEVAQDVCEQLELMFTRS